MSKVKKTIIANNFLDLTEVKLVGKKHDSIGILSVIKAYFAMSESSDGFLDSDEILMIAEGWGVEEPEEWLSLCVAKNIFTEKSGRYFNTHVQKDREKYGKKLEYDRKRKGNNNDSVRNVNGKNDAPDIDIDTDFDNEIDNDLKTSKTSKPEKIKHGEHVYLSKTEVDKFRADLGQDALNRCIDKLDAWIESDPSIKRRKNGKNAGACFRSWVINAVAEEQARASKFNAHSPPGKKTNLDKAKDLMREYEQEANGKAGDSETYEWDGNGVRKLI